MKKKFLCAVLSAALVVPLFGALSACNAGKADPPADNSGWEDLEGWEDDEDYKPPEAIEPTVPSFEYNGTDWCWVGAEGCYFVGGANFEAYKEDGADYVRDILTNLANSTVSFIVNSSSETDVKLIVRTAIDTNYSGPIWASDKFSLTVNGQDHNLNAQEGVDEKWLWQQAEWWKNANYIDANFGTVHLNAGENRFDLFVKSEHVQLDCFIIQPHAAA